MGLRAGFVETDGDIAADRGPDSRKKHTGALIFEYLQSLAAIASAGKTIAPMGGST